MPKVSPAPWVSVSPDSVGAASLDLSTIEKTAPLDSVGAATLDSLSTSIFNSSPMMIALLDEFNKFVLVNQLFESIMGPLFKLANVSFEQTSADNKTLESLTQALKEVRQSCAVIRVRDVNLITVSNPEGFPVPRHFDWRFKLNENNCIIAFGEPVNEADELQREKDAELLDFFQNAPIAMHWLSKDGIIMWANNTELRVLGYSSEEYIGQPIMKFCPDDEGLVLEIFKQLGTGNAIKDVPVRFRAKDGRIIPLLIDSNVNYTDSGQFNHTRCFIRDDTGRKVLEARTDLLLRETQRTLQLFDAFMSRTLHLIRTPCHLLLSNLEALRQGANIHEPAVPLIMKSEALIADIVRVSNDFSDSMRFEQGGTLTVTRTSQDLRVIGKRAVDSIYDLCFPGVTLTFEFEAGFTSVCTDGIVLQRVLGHLLRNAAHATREGSITLRISHTENTVVCTVCDTGKGLTSSSFDMFQRYNMTMTTSGAPGVAGVAGGVEAVRKKLESELALTSGNEGIGLGLSLSYALAQSLGAELCFASQPGDTKLWFALPRADHERGSLSPADSYSPAMCHTSLHITSSSRELNPGPAVFESTSCLSHDSVGTHTHAAKCAAEGVFQAQLQPHVLVVEDSVMCAKVLVNKLKFMGCSSDVADNGFVAISKLRSAAIGQYSLVLMDIRMPVMDGFEATRIAKFELKISTPIVAVTAETSSDVKQKCSEVGFDSCFAKPLANKELQELLDVYIHHKANSNSN